MSDTYNLDFVQGETFTRTFSGDDNGVPINFSLYITKAQVRAKESVSAALLLDLSPYFTTAPDGSSVTLRVPATITAAVDAAKFGKPGTNPTRIAKWDLFLVETADPSNAELLLQGDATCDPASTQTAVTS